MTDGHYLCHIYLGDTGIDIYGYGGEVEYAYIEDTDISLTEMLHSLKVWDKVEEAAYAQRPWNG